MTETTEARLEPCPFCGETPERINIGCATEAVCCRNRDYCGAQPQVWQGAKSLSLWNTRASLPAPTEGEETIVDDWLLAQLERWPTRVDRTRTINIEFLMQEAAKTIRALDAARAAYAAIMRGREGTTADSSVVRAARDK